MKKLIPLMTLCAMFTSSCCTMRHQPYEQVSISSSPSGAKVIIDGYPSGITPYCVAMETKNSHEIILQKEGYQTERYLLKPKVSAKKLSSNAVFPVGIALAGAGAALTLTQGDTSKLAGAVVIAGAICGLAAGTLLGIVGSGVDVYSGKANQLSSDKIQANLKPIPLAPVQE